MADADHPFCGDAPSIERDAATPPLRHRVLVADDNAVNVRIAASMLEKLGCDADIALNGIEAAEMHARRPYDLILMDCQMPLLDGFQATVRIRAREQPGRRRPIIALTASPVHTLREECTNAGMDELISKPLRMDVLQELVSRWLTPVDAPGIARSDPAAQDEVALMQQRHGDDFAELTLLFKIDSNRRIAALEAFASAGDLQNMARIAHAFHGSCVAMGAVSLGRLCADIELQCKAGSIDDWPRRLAAIKAKYESIEAGMNAASGSGS